MLAELTAVIRIGQVVRIFKFARANPPDGNVKSFGHLESWPEDIVVEVMPHHAADAAREYGRWSQLEPDNKEAKQRIEEVRKLGSTRERP